MIDILIENFQHFQFHQNMVAFYYTIMFGCSYIVLFLIIFVRKNFHVI